MDKIIGYIEKNQAKIIDVISLEIVQVYNFLKAEFKKGNIKHNYIFQFAYQKYFQIDNAGLTPTFKEKYFELLQNYRDTKPFPHREIAISLYDILNKRNLKNLQFSFLTKMENMINENSPIYDSEVARVFSYRLSSEKDFDKKLNIYLDRVQYIKETYENIIDEQLLTSTIDLFHKRFSNATVSNIKVLDFIFCQPENILRKNKLLKSKKFKFLIHYMQNLWIL